MKASRKQAAASLHEINVVENTQTNTPVPTHGCTHAIENANERRKTGNVAYEQCKSHNACYCFITGKDMALIYTERCHCATIDAPPPPALGTLVDNYQRYIRETTRIFYVSLPADGLLRRRHCLRHTML